MHITKLLRQLASAAVLLGLAISTGNAQVVSSGMTGNVVDAAGSPIVGATVTVVHTPTNTTYTAVTGPSGRFAVRGMPVGGPYTVEASASGYIIDSITELETALGDDLNISLIGRSDIVTLDRIVTTASRDDLDANATGASSVLGTRRIAVQPTVNRSFADLMKTNPFVSIRTASQVTALGMNIRYNSIMLDGARLNDDFGLASTGLFSLRNPFSLDAIEQFSVSLTPYDVTQSGFAGAAINAVSKSGTNEFHGSAYVIYTADEWQQADIVGMNAGKRPVNFIERTQGFTLGGPILKDRLFFFINYERFFNPSGGPASPGFTPSSSWLFNNLLPQIAALPGSPNLGEFGGAGAASVSDAKRLLKLDWNINADHRMSLRYSDTRGSQPGFGSFNTTGFSSSVSVPGFSNTGYTNGVTSLSSSYYNLGVIEEVWAAQLFSNWTPNLKTQFSFSKNDSESLRTTPVNFPEIRIRNVPGLSSASTPVTVTSGTAFSFGTEVSSMGNGIIKGGISYSGSADYTWRDFAFKIGFDREETDFDNLFRNGSYGVFAYDYSPTLDIATATPIGFARSVALEGSPGTDVSRYEQTGYFIQAKWDPSPRFNITLGLRYDVLGSPISPPYNAAFSAAFDPLYPGIRNDATIDGSSRFAPRVSFNYALDEERKTQVRGGLGVFLGRNPWVWISNSYSRPGFGRFYVRRPSTGGATIPTLAEYLSGTFSDPDPAFVFDPSDPMGKTNIVDSDPQEVNLITPGLKLPTNLRGNIAVDRKIPVLNATLTVEYIHNEAIAAMFYENLNLLPTTVGADGRQRFAGSTDNGGPNARVSTFGRVIRLRNVEAGESDYVSIMLDRPFKNGWSYNIAYTRGRALEAQSSGSSTAGSNWANNVVFNRDQVELARAEYEVTDRLQFTVAKEFKYFGRLKSTVALYYEGRSGQPFSYTYSGDLNGDGVNSNDVVAVPTGLNDSRFDFSGMTTAQQDAYFRYIKQSGLEKYAGSYAPRNAFTTPWQNRLDLRFTQELRAYNNVTLEFFADFLNFGAWLSKDLFNYVETINPTRAADIPQIRILGNASYTADGRIRPTVTLDSDGNISFPAASLIQASNIEGRWRVQAGMRLRF